jgi:hypothetical protein
MAFTQLRLVVVLMVLAVAGIAMGYARCGLPSHQLVVLEGVR